MRFTLPKAGSSTLLFGRDNSRTPNEQAYSTFPTGQQRRDRHRIRSYCSWNFVAIIAAVSLIGTNLNTMFSSISSQLK